MNLWRRKRDAVHARDEAAGVASAAGFERSAPVTFKSKWQKLHGHQEKIA
jgi:hypothetical protein